MAITLSAPIDANKPVETISGHQAIVRHEYSNGEMLGFVLVNDRKYEMHWNAKGEPLSPGDPMFSIRNVAQAETPAKIDITKPVKTADGRTVINLIDHGEMLSGFIQNPDKPYQVMGPVHWKLDGSGVAPHVNISNVPEQPPEPTEREREAALIEGFYSALEHRFGEDYCDKLYYDALVAGEYGFVRNKENNDDWEVWSLVDDFEQMEERLPSSVIRADVAKFYDWLRNRLERERDKGYDDGMVNGRKQAAIRIQTRYNAFLSAMSGDDAFANGSFPE